MNNNLNNSNNNNLNSDKQLPDVFRELQEIQRQQALRRKATPQIFNANSNKTDNRFDYSKVQAQTKKKKKTKKHFARTKQESPNLYEYEIPKIEGSKKFNAVGVIIGILILILVFTPLQSNYAISNEVEPRKYAIAEFEVNDIPLDFMDIVSQNISEVEKKEIVTEQYLVEREVEYIDDNQMPKNEEILIEEGSDGTREVTYIRGYENDEMTSEKVINDYIVVEPMKKVIRRGTSEYLESQMVHIGDTMYTTEGVIMLFEPNISSDKICKIYQYIDVKLEEVLEDNWCRVSIDGYSGYVDGNSLTSAVVTPDIVEKCRIQRIMITVKYDMPLNKPSGLTREDFIKVLSDNEQDTKKIFQDNAEVFYELEQKYNVNGIFLAAIGIHESAWGTSTIANNKKNLFGYGAYDSSPYSSAFSFDTYAEGIELLAKVLSKYYLNERGTRIYDDEVAVASFYNGPTVSGVNIRYASDKQWCEKVYAKMEALYKKLQ